MQVQPDRVRADPLLTVVRQVQIAEAFREQPDHGRGEFIAGADDEIIGKDVLAIPAGADIRRVGLADGREECLPALRRIRAEQDGEEARLPGCKAGQEPLGDIGQVRLRPDRQPIGDQDDGAGHRRAVRARQGGQVGQRQFDTR